MSGLVLVTKTINTLTRRQRYLRDYTRRSRNHHHLGRYSLPNERRIFGHNLPRSGQVANDRGTLRSIGVAGIIHRSSSAELARGFDKLIQPRFGPYTAEGTEGGRIVCVCAIRGDPASDNAGQIRAYLLYTGFRGLVAAAALLGEKRLAGSVMPWGL